MNRLILIACVAGITANAFSFDADSDFRKFATGMAAKVEQAFNSRDVSFFDKISTPDFSEKEMGQTVSKAQAMAQMKQMFGMAKSVDSKIKVVSTKANGNTAVAMTSGHTIVILKPMGPKDKKTHRLVVDNWEKETWVKTGKTWKIRLLEEAKPSKMTMDGKPYNPSMMGGK